MSWMEVIEVEEFVGSHWHRIISNGVASYGSHPEAAVTLDQVRASLGVFFGVLAVPRVWKSQRRRMKRRTTDYRFVNVWGWEKNERFARHLTDIP